MCSRPDICYAVTYLSRFQHKPNTETWTYMKRVLRYLKGTLDQKLTYDRNISENALYGYVDADWGSDKQDRKSTTGYVYYIYGCLCMVIKEAKRVSFSVLYRGGICSVKRSMHRGHLDQEDSTRDGIKNQ
ncbi:hypothetical protein QE152_g19890 [Popillia japonica]|uniref:Uncharacterized protein n=1 Tax=Popillia japonica TaxID=7064 RepID=A0AAW1KMN9_POPJA